MLSIATLKAKLIIAGILLAIAGAGGFYVWYLNHRIDSLKEDKIELTSQVKESQEVISETGRMNDVIDNVSSIGNEERIIIKHEYDRKIKEIDSNVEKGNDKPVGVILNDFFNNRLHNEN